MLSAPRPIAAVLAAMALIGLLCGCSSNAKVTAENAAPGAAKNNREDMIKWHQQHDKNPLPPR